MKERQRMREDSRQVARIGHGDDESCGGGRWLIGVPAKEIGLPEGLAELAGERVRP